jgi:Putative abortive phage resistance protein AbiGi, antitoxin
MLTHYTFGIDSLIGILANGFAWVANPRDLMPLLLPDCDFSRREPQQFGMVSFTELGPTEAASHTSVFGQFGVVMQAEWVADKEIQRVVYIDSSGPATASWQSIFAIAHDDLTSHLRFPDETAQLMEHHNKAMARIRGAVLWADLLQMYEYMESSDFAAEREWRAVVSTPNYSISESRSDAVASISPAKNWAKYFNALTFCPRDVKALVCPSASVSLLRRALSPSFAHVEIIAVSTTGSPLVCIKNWGSTLRSLITGR